MTETHTDINPAELTPREARAAKPVKGMPYVLGISTAAVIVIFSITLISFV